MWPIAVKIMWPFAKYSTKLTHESKDMFGYSDRNVPVPLGSRDQSTLGF